VIAAVWPYAFVERTLKQAVPFASNIRAPTVRFGAPETEGHVSGMHVACLFATDVALPPILFYHNAEIVHRNPIFDLLFPSFDRIVFAGQAEQIVAQL